MAESSKSKLYFGIALVAILLFSLFLILQIALLQKTLRVVVNAVARISFLSIKTPPAAQQNALDTSDWKTYRNEEYGFEFRYPLSWTNSSTLKSDPELIPYLLNEGFADSSNQFRSIHVLVFNKKWISNFDFSGQKLVFDSSDSLRIGDKFFIKKGDIVIQLFFTYEKSNPELFDQILSTFKFIQ
jgi:hypothetical protein